MFAQVHLQKLSKWERQGKLGGSMKSSGNWSSHTWSACRLGYWSFLGGIAMSWLWSSHLGDDDQWASSPRWDIVFLRQSFLFIITISIIIIMKIINIIKKSSLSSLSSGWWWSSSLVNILNINAGTTAGLYCHSLHWQNLPIYQEQKKISHCS